MRQRGTVYRDLMGKLEGKNPLGTPRRRWQDSINLRLQERGVLKTPSSCFRIRTGAGPVRIW